MTTTKEKPPNEMTLAEHAEAWHKENGRAMPKNRESKRYQKMYEQWVEFAFADFRKTI